MNVRLYKSEDYEQVAALYKNSDLYGGQFDENRDSKERLEARADAIFVAEEEGKIVGTVSLIEDGRVAWLFRFAVIGNREDVARALAQTAEKELESRGHHQVLVYTPVGNDGLNGRYEKLGFTKGNDYTCYYKNI